jgi:hypothetical protein
LSKKESKKKGAITNRGALEPLTGGGGITVTCDDFTVAFNVRIKVEHGQGRAH